MTSGTHGMLSAMAASSLFPAGQNAPASTDANRRLRESPLMRQGAFRVIPALYGQEGPRALLAEARQLAPGCHENHVPAQDTFEGRGGNPSRKFLSCPAGPVQDHYYHHPAIIDFFRRLTGMDVQPTGPRGTYTYYARAGDYLAVHRDIHTCDLAVVTCLADAAPADSDSGLMEFYPTRLDEPLGAIRQTLAQGRVRRRLLPGETVVMFGGVLPHAIAPVEAGRGRIVSVLCYETC